MADLEELLQVWRDEASRSWFAEAVAKHRAAGNTELAETAAKALATVGHASPLAALEANAQLVTLLTRRRWYVIRDAREQGASWDDVAAALGMSIDTVRAHYTGRIAAQEMHLGDLHDAARARAVLAEEATDEAACVRCGCTENRACPGGCCWVPNVGMPELLAEVDRLREELAAATAPRRVRVRHEEIAERARAVPGQWVLVGEYPKYGSARTTASSIRTGVTLAWQPCGAYEAKRRTEDGVHRLYARYLGAASQGGEADAQ